MGPEKHESGIEVIYTVAASPEEQKELELRRQAEKIVDRAHELYETLGTGRRLKEGVALLDATDDDYEEVPQEPYDREKAIQDEILRLKAHESYHNRSMQEIVNDTLSWVQLGRDEDQQYALRHTLYREAYYVLNRASEGEEKTAEVDSELLKSTVQWAALEYFSYHEYREWDQDDVTPEGFVELIEKSGITQKDFEVLLNIPINSEAEKIATERGYDSFDTLWGNYVALESQMLERAKELGLKVGEVHNYGNYLTAWGI